MIKLFRQGVLTVALVLTFVSVAPCTVVVSQNYSSHDRSMMHGEKGNMDLEHHAPGSQHSTIVSEKIQAQIDRIYQAVKHLDTPEKAKAAGYELFPGQVVTMGEHWIKQDYVEDGIVDLTKPESLQYSPIAGEMKLVAVSFINPQSADAPGPDVLIGAQNSWHRHDPAKLSKSFFDRMVLGRNFVDKAFAVLGGDLGVAMVHVWFVPAINGPYTDHNHFLPFLGHKLPVPNADLIANHRDLIARTSLALAELYGWPGGQLWDNLRWQTAKQTVHSLNKMQAIVPRLEAALAANRNNQAVKLMGEMTAEWQNIRQIREASMNRIQKRIVDGVYQRMLGDHMH